jgi:hypothetical protein
MRLQEGCIYISPDGRRFHAKVETRNRAPNEVAWTLVPIPLDGGAKMGWILFLERGRILRFDFEIMGIAVDTGWTVDELRAE